jgi:hypothetical protein
MLTEETLDIAGRKLIERFAAGDATLRHDCIAVYDAAIRRHAAQDPSLELGDDFHMIFMQEIVAPVPDLARRAEARGKVTGRL